MNKEQLIALKSNIGFKEAFKATLGFYAASILVGTLQFVIIITGIFTLINIFKD